MLKLSLCMIVKNEENNIVKCLERALKVVDEAIIIDTGSTDKTKKLINEHFGKKKKLKVYEYVWKDDFSKARNETLKYCTGDWILVLDADERVFINRDKLDNFLINTDKKAFITPIYNILDDKNIVLSSTMTRLYKNDNPYYKGAIHEQLFINNMNYAADVIDSNLCNILHYGYCSYIFNKKNKQKRNMELIQDEIIKDPTNPFNYFNRGIMEMSKGNYANAIDDFTKCNELTNKIRYTFHNELVLSIIICMMRLNKFDDVINFINIIENDDIIKKISDIYYYRGIAYRNNEEYELAIDDFKKAICIGEYKKGMSQYGAGSFLPKIEWSKVLYNQDEKELSIEKLKEAIFDEHNINKVGFENLSNLLKEENRLFELLDLNNYNKNQVSDDLEKYRVEIKKNITQLVEVGLINEAKELIKEYQNIVDNDIEIYSIKGVISMIEGDLITAEKFLKQGLEINNNNYDILYNLAYLYNNNNDIELAKRYYKLALLNASTNEDINSVRAILKTLGVQNGKNDIIPNTSIIILTYNNLEYNKLCIESIRRYTEEGTYEIIIVDNNSTDGTVQWLNQQKDLKIIFNHENVGFPKGCNQGIVMASENNDILLLNNDTVVTPNWLINLKKCLYSKDDIGAAGGVSNSCTNYQVINYDYDTLDDMIPFAKKNNISNESMWEQRNRLIGFFMLIKNNIIKEIGLLDEDFTPGNFEDDDYSFRIRKAGYRLMLCKDSFIHHFGSLSFSKLSKEYDELLINNRIKFVKKWGFDPNYINSINKDITDLIKQSKLEQPYILHIGCEGGSTLLDIANVIPSAKLYGIEPVKDTVDNSENFAQIITGTIEKIECFKDEYFDYVFITNPNIINSNIDNSIKLCMKKIKDNGKIYIFNDESSDKYSQVITKYNTSINNSIRLSNINDEIVIIEKDMTSKLTIYNEFNMKQIESNIELNIEEKIAILLRRLETKKDFDNNYIYLKNILVNNIYKIDNLKNIIIKNSIDKVECFNILGVIYYELNKLNDALEFFTEAYKLNNENDDAIYNIIYILHQCNENQMALDFYNDIKHVIKNEKILELKKYIEEIA